MREEKRGEGDRRQKREQGKRRWEENGWMKRRLEVEKANTCLNCVFARGPSFNTLKKDLYHSTLEFIPPQGITARYSMAKPYDFLIKA